MTIFLEESPYGATFAFRATIRGFFTCQDKEFHSKKCFARSSSQNRMGSE